MEDERQEGPDTQLFSDSDDDTSIESCICEQEQLLDNLKYCLEKEEETLERQKMAAIFTETIIKHAKELIEKEEQKLQRLKSSSV